MEDDVNELNFTHVFDETRLEWWNYLDRESLSFDVLCNQFETVQGCDIWTELR